MRRSAIVILVVLLFIVGCQKHAVYDELNSQLFQVTQAYDPYGTFLFFSDNKIKSPIKSGSNVKLDADGIPTILINQEYVYNIVTIAQYGLQEYGYYLSKNDEKHLDAVKATADWLVNNQDKSSGKWYYHYDYAVGMMDYTMKGPWSSAMAQGQAISLLVRANHVFPNKQYIETAERALKPLQTDVEDGGLTRELFGHPFYEEFPTTPGSFALNGFMFTLFGLYDLSIENPDSIARSLYQQGIHTLVALLPLYDQHETSAYHLGHISNPPRKVHYNAEYHRIHVIQLEALSKMTENDTIQYYYDLWSSYLEPRN